MVEDTPVKSPPRRRWLWWGMAVGLLACAAAVAVAWFVVGSRVWTDGGSIRVADRDTRVRQILWMRPRPMEGFASDQQVYEPSLSPDGTELYFVRGKAGSAGGHPGGSGGAHVFVSYRRNNAWTAAVPVDAINGNFDSLGPRVTPDGRFLLFYSDRPGGYGGYDIWAAPRVAAGGWGKPFNLGPHVNSEFNEFNPDPTPDGKRLIFATNRAAARHEQNEAWRSTIRETVSTNYDLWMADVESAAGPNGAAATDEPATTQPAAIAGDAAPATQPASTEPATTMSATRPAAPSDPEPSEAAPSRLAFAPARELPGVNTEYTEGASCMSPAGDFLYFASNRPGGAGKFDIYRCRVHGDQFGPVENVGPPINSAENEADPALTFNGFRMVFSSDRPGADGRYHLLVADSREVYPERQGHPAPHLGWSAWLLIASLLVLVPLLMFLRGWEDHRLNALQKCLLLSLLVHAAITFLLSFVAVTQQVSRYVRSQIGMEVAVSLKDAPGEAEGLAIRGQVSNDLPTAGAAPATLQPVARAASASEAVEPVGPVDVPLPGARIAPGAMAIAAPSPSHPPIEVAKGMPVTAADATASPDVGDVHLPNMHALAQAEARPQVEGAPAQSTRSAAAAAAELAISSPGSIASNAPPTAKPAPAPMMDVIPSMAPSRIEIASGRGHEAAPGTSVNPNDVPAADPSAALAGRLAGTRQHQAEATPAAGASARGPTTQPVDLTAVASMHAATASPPDAIALAGTPAAADHPSRPSPTLAVGIPASAPTNIPAAASGVRPSDAVAARPIEEVAVNPAGAPGGKVSAPARAGEPGSEPAGPTAMARLKPSASDASAASGTGAPSVLSSEARLPSAAPAGGSSLASADAAGAGPAAHRVALDAMAGAVRPAASTAAGGDAAEPEVSGPPMANARAGTRGGSSAERAIGASAVAPTAKPTRDATSVPAGVPKPIDIGAAPVQASAKLAARGSEGLDDVRLPRAQMVEPSAGPEIVLAPLAGALGPGKLAAPDTPFMRAPEQRKPLLEKFGGTKQSEDAVAMGLAYLARMQETDGRWTRVDDDGPPGRRGPAPHDMACTAFAVLAFLGQDHTPDKPGPYREVVARAVAYLIAAEDEDGDLRGPPQFRGGGSDASNMYDQGIATYALAECAIMTRDPKTVEAATRAARFIVQAQNAQTGGWRYSPGEPGDSSVFGWQIMALHSAEQIGFRIPDETIEGATRYIQSCAEGRHGLLAGYQPHNGATHAMTAELLFSRMLLGIPLDDDGMLEATRFLAQAPPDPNNCDLYYWYYASLSMLNMNNPLWKHWNVLTRESLIRLQRQDGPARGCWDRDMRWSGRGGRVFTTAMATLTLEVYYRYLPIRAAATTEPDAAGGNDHATPTE